MPLGKGLRRSLYIIGFALLGLLVVWFALPLWFPWALGPVARRQGLSFAKYEREGYGRLALQEVTLTNASGVFRAARAEMLVPSVWLWRRLAGQAPPPRGFARIEDWEYVPTGTGGTSNSVYEEVQTLRQRLLRLGSWVPKGELTNGLVLLNKRKVRVPLVAWDQGKVRAKLAVPEPLTLSGNLAKGPPYALEVRSAPLHLQGDVQLRFTPRELQVQSRWDWWSNRIELAGAFAQTGRWPVQARLQAPKFHLPAALFQLEGYRDVSGSLLANWEQGRFGLDLDARAHPLEEQGHLPPVLLDLHASGDTNAATIEAARVSSPGFNAELSQALTLHFSGPLLHRTATLKVTADLAREPWVPLDGQLTGEADFVPTAARLPVTFFHLTGAGVGTAQVKARSVRLNANLNWPWLDITSAKGEFEDGSAFSAAGKVELVSETITGGQLQFNGPLAARWLPPGYSYQMLSLTGAIQGPVKDPSYTGHLEVGGFGSPGLQPLQFRADWAGRKQSVEHAEIIVATDHSSLTARGALMFGSAESTLQLTNLVLSTNNAPALSLVEPWRLSAERAATNQGWRLSMTPLDLAGPGGEVHIQGALDWPSQGTLQVALTNLSSTLLSGFMKSAVPEVHLQRLSASAAWTNGPATLSLEMAATHELTTGSTNHAQPAPELRSIFSRPLSMELRLQGDQNGLLVSNLVVSTQGAPLTTAHGKLPVTLNPSALGQALRVDLHQPLQFEATAQPRAFFWNALTTTTGVALDEPNLRLRAAGTWDAPSGELALHARQIQFQQGPTNLPALQNLQVAVTIDRGKVQLSEGRVFVQGQPVLLTAELPLEAQFWSDVRNALRPDGASAVARLRADALRYYENARAHVLIQSAQLAAFSEMFPKLLSPEGELNLDLVVLPGFKLDGSLVLSHARTRPLGNAGPIRDIQVRMRFTDRTLRLERASAGVGGTALTAQGTMDLRGNEWLHGTLPPFQFHLYGTNVPLARQPSAIIRSDLNLTLTHTNGAPPLIAGTARLRDSFYLTDLASLVPGKVAAPQRRPPYFSVDDPMLEDWRLHVRVQGQRFLKVLSPLFTGEVSADLNLQGTLKDPIALGDLKTDSGVVRFPFANFQVRQGLVTLTSQDPFRPQLFVLGDSRQFGYDLRMDLTGPVDAPVLQFTSTPPLASEQILLMVTAGELPRGELNLTSQQKAQTMAMFLGRDLLSKLGFGEQTEARLSIHTNEEISQVGRSTYDVEYKLNQRWSLEGEYDRFGDFNAGFKWRIYSK